MKGAVFDIAIKETATGLQTISESNEQVKRHNRNIVGGKEQTPGVGSYDIYNSGIGTGFDPPSQIYKSNDFTTENGRIIPLDQRSRRKEILESNTKLSRIRGVSIRMAKRKDLSTVDPDIDAGPADYNLKSTVP